jgi:hypothetical protein
MKSNRIEIARARHRWEEALRRFKLTYGSDKTENYVKVDREPNYAIVVYDVEGVTIEWTFDDTTDGRTKAITRAKALARQLGCDWGSNF